MVYVVVALGETDTVIGLVLPLKVAPLLNVPLQGPLPVTAMLKLALLPLQMVCEPLITAVGLTLTRAVCVLIHPPGLVAVTVYVVVCVGVAVTLAPDAVFNPLVGVHVSVGATTVVPVTFTLSINQ